MNDVISKMRANVAIRIRNHRHYPNREYTRGFLELLAFTAEDVRDYRTRDQAYRIAGTLDRIY